MVSDEEFVQEALAHIDMLYNIARRLTDGREEAEDLVQETYLGALQGWRRERPEKTGPWLATICLNAARSRYRRRGARPIEQLDPDPGLDTPAHEDTAAEALNSLDREVVHRALHRLTIEQREAITLMDLCGFTASQAATMLDSSRNTVLSRVHRGHKRLALLLQEETRRDP